MKLQQVLNSQRLEKKNYIRQVRALNFWHGGDQKLVFVRALSEKSEALAIEQGTERRQGKCLLKVSFLGLSDDSCVLKANICP